MKPQTFWTRLGRAMRGTYFIVGSVLVALLVLTAVLGPEVAPHNPFLVKPLQWFDGELHKAPFPPSELYPLGTDDLGRDQLSLLLYGARTTLLVAFITTIVRMLVGLLLGTFAGWWPGSLFDRLVNAFSEFLASIPGLVLAMLLVFAVGIGRGVIAFVVALSVVGCGEVTQIMRGHVLSVRNEAYIDAARAVGLNEAEILSRHVLPNLLGTLVAMAALEMGAVLLLLGELGFVQVFIGGGRTGVSMSSFNVSRYFDVPDWGAMLGSSWRWFRSYPWYPMTPATALFVSILSFNLFGYGLQRFVERGRFHPSGWSVLRFLIVTALIVLGARFLVQGVGIEAQFAQLAREFDVERAWEDIDYLTQPALEGRPAGSIGAAMTAEYIADQFRQAGLSPTTPGGSYMHHYTTFRGRVTAPPIVEVLGAAGEATLRLQEGVSLDPWQAFQLEGSLDAPLVLFGNAGYESIRERMVLLLFGHERIYIPGRVRESLAAILRVVPDDQLAGNEQAPPFDDSSYLRADRLPNFPYLLISESAARQMLAQAGLDLDEYAETARSGGQFMVDTGVRVRVTAGLVYDEVEATNVVGYIAGMGAETRGERVLLAATYAGTPPRDGQIYPGADDNASGVAVMLETARLLASLDWIPKRTIVFAAFDAGGGGQFVNYTPLPTERTDLWTTVILEGVGAGHSPLARLEVGSGLARAFDQSARRFGVHTEPLDEWIFFFVSSRSRLSWSSPTVNKAYQALAVTRLGDDLSGTPADTPEHLDRELLEETGQAITHYVMVLSFR